MLAYGRSGSGVVVWSGPSNATRPFKCGCAFWQVDALPLVDDFVRVHVTPHPFLPHEAQTSLRRSGQEFAFRPAFVRARSLSEVAKRCKDHELRLMKRVTLSTAYKAGY